MTDRTMFDFLTQLVRREGGWVIEPVAAALDADGYLRSLLDRLRTVPARVSSPDPKRPYRFAERGQHGRWFIIWVPDDE